MRFLMLVIATSFLFVACQNQNRISNQSAPGDGIDKPAPLTGLRVVDANGAAIAGAQVLIGAAVDAPFEGNFLTTNADGEVALPEEWQNEQPVTVDAAGFLRTTYLSQVPQPIEVTLVPEDGEQNLEVRGRATGFGRLQRDGYVDAALMMRGNDRLSLFQFDMSQFVSPEIDVISIVGRRVKLPSNLSIPRQRESYILPITLNKPIYRSFYRTPGTHDVFGTHIRFKLKDVVDKVRAKKPFYDIINDFEFQAGGIRQTVIAEEQSSIDVPINEIMYEQDMQIEAPTLASDQVMLTLTAMERNNKLYLVDFKALESRESETLKYTSTDESYLIFVKQNKSIFKDGLKSNNRPITAHMHAMNSEQRNRQFLDYIAQPELEQGVVSVATPITGAGSLKESGMMVTLSQVELINNGLVDVEFKYRDWQIFGNRWQSQVTLPQWPGSSTLSSAAGDERKSRVEVMLLANPDGASRIGPAMVEDATHITYNKRDY